MSARTYLRIVTSEINFQIAILADFTITLDNSSLKWATCQSRNKTAALNHSATSPMQPGRVSAAAWVPVSFVLGGKSRAGLVPGRKYRKLVWNGDGIERGELWHVPAPGAVGWVGQGAQRHRNMTKVWGRRSGVVGRV